MTTTRPTARPPKGKGTADKSSQNGHNTLRDKTYRLFTYLASAGLRRAPQKTASRH